MRSLDPIPKVWIDMNTSGDRDAGRRVGFWVCNFSSEHTFKLNKRDLATGFWLEVPAVTRERRMALSLGKESQTDNSTLYTIQRVQYLLTPLIIDAVGEVEEELNGEAGVVLVARELMSTWVRDGRHPGRLKNPRSADRNQRLYHWNLFHEPPTSHIIQQGAVPFRKVHCV